MASRKAASKYQVTGLIINVGYSPSLRQISSIVTQLRKDVPEFAALVSKDVRASLLGKGADDILVPINPRKSKSIAEAWGAVHALMAHELVTDCEPAVQVPSEQEPPLPATLKSGGSNHDAPGSEKQEWSVDLVHARSAWSQFSVSGKGVKVGHPDTGYTRHPEILDSRLLVAEGYNFEEDSADPLDPLKGSGTGHGAATASVIMANSTNSPRVFGVAPAVKLVPLRVSDSVVHFNFSNVAQALYRARDRKCHLVSMSLGGPWAGRSLGRAVDTVIADGLILLAAAGNKWPWVVYPALFDNVVAVAACGPGFKPWRSSAAGPAVDITAPGDSVWRAMTNKKGAEKYPVKRSSGTSYAVATTAGVCALWLEHHGVAELQARYGGRLAAVFLSLLKASVTEVPGWDASAYGPGVLNATKLLETSLPALGAASRKTGMATPANAQGIQAIDRLQKYFPELTLQQLAKATTAILGDRAKGRGQAKVKNQAPSRPTLMDEVEFYVATDAGVRAAFLAAGGKGKTRAGLKSATSQPAKALEALASEPLRQLIKA
ncbi:S8/S53 family peptidase [Luteimonas sp. MJ250]|uniref:S8 family peptidase n=1 Tax=Luteimonas sp. MJ250 TaxID=3129236 RepID=UPI0031BA22CD